MDKDLAPCVSLEGEIHFVNKRSHTKSETESLQSTTACTSDGAITLLVKPVFSSVVFLRNRALESRVVSAKAEHGALPPYVNSPLPPPFILTPPSSCPFYVSSILSCAAEGMVITASDKHGPSYPTFNPKVDARRLKVVTDIFDCTWRG